MKITTFKNLKGLIHGKDPKRIECDKNGTLLIGNTEIVIKANEDTILPPLFFGGSGDYDASFITEDGITYKLKKVEIRGGRISPPPHTTIELMELRCRADAAEEERDRMREEINELKNIFDTNSLNFLIK